MRQLLVPMLGVSKSPFPTIDTGTIVAEGVVVGVAEEVAVAVDVAVAVSVGVPVGVAVGVVVGVLVLSTTAWPCSQARSSPWRWAS